MNRLQGVVVPHESTGDTFPPSIEIHSGRSKLSDRFEPRQTVVGPIVYSDFLS